MNKVIELGSKVKDNVTTLEGIAVARIEYLNGCVKYDVQPVGLHEGKLIDGAWIDIHQLEVLTDESEKRVVESSTGAPGNTPSAFRTPRK